MLAWTPVCAMLSLFVLATSCTPAGDANDQPREADAVQQVADDIATSQAPEEAEEAPVRDERQITIATADDRARLCPQPDCRQGAESARIQTGTSLVVEGTSLVCQPLWDVTWFKVTYQGSSGWVSQFNTDEPEPEHRDRPKRCP